MKLANVQTFVVQTPPPHSGGSFWFFVKLETDTGIVGWGETAILGTLHGLEDSYELLVKQVFEGYLEGKDPIDREALYHKMYEGMMAQHPDYVGMGVVSAIDIALWDITGKHYNTPIYNLLGGKYRDRVRTYTYIYDEEGSTTETWTSDAERLGVLAAKFADEGFTGLKFDPLPQSPPRRLPAPPWEVSLQDYDNAERGVAAVRKAVGNRADILIGTHGQITPSAARRLAARIEKYDPLWLEEPCPPENYQQMGEIARRTSIPIATGERLVGIHEFQNLFAQGGCAFAQPDLGSCGGITACKKIATMAEANYILMAPHIWGGPIITAAAVQIDVNIPNFLIQESIHKSRGFFDEIVVEPFEWDNGDLIPSDRPGIGIELDEAKLEEHRGSLAAIRRARKAKAQGLSNPPVDVLIIGAGASAAAFAWSLADTKMQILCLEQGDWVNPLDYPSGREDWESNNAFNSNPNHRQNAADYPINDNESPIAVANYNGVGGGTILFAGHYPRFHPADFKVNSLDGVAQDWPLDYQQLEPFYDENDRMMGTSGLAGDPAYPPKQPLMPPIPLGRAGTTLARGFNKLGWHWWPSDMAIATEPYDGRDKCINLGACGTGCAQGAKASTDITYWPHAQRAGVTLKTQCRVREITVDDNGLATGATYYDSEGVEQHQPAEMVVMACNGIGTPRILLNSTSAKFPNGLGNSSGMLGKNLMFHPYAVVEGIFDEPLDGAKGPHKCIASHEFYETDPNRGFVRGFSFETQRGYGPVATALNGTFSGRIPRGAGHHDAYAKLQERMVALVAVCEDLPEEHNRVTLDPDLKDAHGIPAPKVHYSLSENSAKMLDYAVARGRDIMDAAGATNVTSQRLLKNAGWHNMGTARMGTNPDTSVVNEWGRSHDVNNLFVIDGSIFVTSAGVNPTRTIQALALYIADSIKQKLASATLFD